MLKLLSLFSGIGAFEKALDRVNVPYKLVNYCEFDKYASKSYSLIHKTPETMNLGDITKVDLRELHEGQADMITYGFPCQDISLAGKQAGFEKDGQLTRSGLFFYASAIIGIIKPKVAICENVKNLTSKKFEKEFKIVLDSLEELGYNNYWQVLNSKNYGIPQNRERVFIISIRKDLDNGKFEFPQAFSLDLRLKDMLEDTVDEKYFLSDKMISYILATGTDRETGEKLLIKCATKKGYMEAEDGDGCYITNIDKKRGTVQKGMIPTLKTSPDIGVVVKDNTDRIIIAGKTRSGGERSLILDEDGVCNCLTATDHKQPKQVLVRDKSSLFTETQAKMFTPDGDECPTINGTTVSSFVTKVKDKRGNELPLNTKNIRIKKLVENNDFTGADGQFLDVYNQNVRNDDCFGSLKVGMDWQQGNICFNNLRIRKLTPKECFRLMGFDDEDIDILIENKISNTQLYKLAGNSIVVNVIEKIYCNLFNLVKELI